MITSCQLEILDARHARSVREGGGSAFNEDHPEMQAMQQIHRRQLNCLYFVILMVCIWQAALCISSGEAQIQSGRQDVTEVMELIDKMPEWPTRPVVVDREKEIAKDVELLESIATKITEYDLAVIRQAMDQYEREVRTGKRLVFDEKQLFIINKFLFRIPARVRRDSRHFQSILSGWRGMPISGDPDNPTSSDEASAGRGAKAATEIGIL